MLDMPKQNKAIDKVIQIRTGKFRRYHGEGLKQLLDIETMLKNIRDFFYVIIGIFQSVGTLRQQQPDVIFIKGGIVGVPIGLAAMFLGIPYITHDSDAVPGLGHRLIGRSAKLHTVAMPTTEYNYESRKTVQVGVPVNKNYKFVSVEASKKAKKRLNIPPTDKVILVTGGGLGAVRLNEAVINVSKKMTRKEKYWIIHMVGPGNSERVETQYAAAGADMSKIIVKDFVPDLHKYSAASDLVVTRAGATTLTEFGVQARACIVVPNANLTGGHQLKNARVLEKMGAIVVVDDRQMVKDNQLLYSAITKLMGDSKKRAQLAEQINKSVIKDSARKIATILTDSGLEKS